METTGSFKSRICKKKLLEELERLEKERCSSLRLLQASRNIFQKKYQKFTLPLSRRGSEAASVQMFDTHSPGFCYHRNGDCRTSDRLQKVETASLTDAQALLELLQTDGEVDIEKVVCLHLLAAHMPPGLSTSSQHLRHSFSSQTGEQFTSGSGGVVGQRAAPRLPVYVISVTACGLPSNALCKVYRGSREDLDDGRGTAPLLLNAQLERLVDTAVDTLQEVNHSKVNALMELVSSPLALRSLLAKRKIQALLNLLSSAELLSSEEAFITTTARLCSSPTLRPPTQADKTLSVTVLSVTDTSSSLYKLILKVRRRIFWDSDIPGDSQLWLCPNTSGSKVSSQSSVGTPPTRRRRMSSAASSEVESLVGKDSVDGSSNLSLSAEEVPINTHDYGATKAPAETSFEQGNSYPVLNKIARSTAIPGFEGPISPLPRLRSREKKTPVSKSGDNVPEGQNLRGKRKMLKQETRGAQSATRATESSWKMDPGGALKSSTLQPNVEPPENKLSFWGKHTSSVPAPQPATLTQEAVVGFRLEIASSEAYRRLLRFLKTASA